MDSKFGDTARISYGQGFKKKLSINLGRGVVMGGGHGQGSGSAALVNKFLNKVRDVVKKPFYESVRKVGPKTSVFVAKNCPLPLCP